MTRKYRIKLLVDMLKSGDLLTVSQISKAFGCSKVSAANYLAQAEKFLNPVV